MEPKRKYWSNQVDKNAGGSALTECSALFLIITAVWSIACADKGIWPFGRNLLDIGDMMEQSVPAYTHLWDAIHEGKSLLFDWNTGFGNNMAGVVLHFGLISPFNIFFLFVKRSAIETSMSVYILIKLIATGYGMRFVLRKWFPSFSDLMTVTFSLLYVFSVFNMQYYFTVMWLDVSFMFPLVMYGYFLLMNEKKAVPYIVSLAVTCMMSFQHTYMVFLMLLILTGLLPLFSKVRYRNVLTRLLAATLISLMLSAWILLPGSLQILQAGRLSSTNGLIEMWNSVWIFYTAKWMKLLNLGIPLSLFLLYALKHFRQKDTRFFCSVIALLCAPIVLESTNLMWHGGSYEGYTIRFAYMIAFWILAAGAYAYDRRLAGSWAVSGKKLSETAGIAAFVLYAAITAVQYFLFRSVGDSVYKTEISAFVIILIVIVNVIAGCGLLFNQKRTYDKFAFLLTICSIVTLAVNTIFVSAAREDTFISMLAEAGNSTGGGSGADPLIRIKSLDFRLSHNYPLIMNQNALSNYLAINSYRQMEEINRMGYAKVGFRLSDYGGTLFSDALFGVGEVISSVDVNESLYQYERFYGDYHVYRCLYGYEQGIRVRNNTWENDGGTDNPFIHQNQIAKEVLGRELLEITNARGGEINVEIDEESVLYLYSGQEKSFETVKVTDLNTGEESILTLSESGWMNGILELGTWADTSLRIQILSQEQVEEVFCAVLPLQGFAANQPDYFENYRVDHAAHSLHISLDGAVQGDYLFLPVYHDSGWNCTVNGGRVSLEDFAGYFISIPLQTGKNEIALSFRPPGWTAGIIFALTGILLSVILCRYPVRKEREAIGRVLFVLDEAVFGALMLMFYFIPVCFLLRTFVQAAIGVISG